VSTFEAEVAANYDSFDNSSFTMLNGVREELSADRDRFLESYRHVASLQAWRATLLQELLSTETLAFFLEAQNDALLSHVMARMGIWRPALQSLRSCIENTLMTLYYMDHPVELMLWAEGRHRLGFAEVHTYLQRHPLLDSVAESLSGLPVLQAEYATLSRAVHGSAVSFRMADTNGPQLWSSDRAKLGSWQTRERQVIVAINLLLLSMFREKLQGTSRPALRDASGAIMSKTRRAQIKSALKISL
jgi:hypothetical protein